MKKRKGGGENSRIRRESIPQQLLRRKEKQKKERKQKEEATPNQYNHFFFHYLHLVILFFLLLLFVERHVPHLAAGDHLRRAAHSTSMDGVQRLGAADARQRIRFAATERLADVSKLVKLFQKDR